MKGAARPQKLKGPNKPAKGASTEVVAQYEADLAAFHQQRAPFIEAVERLKSECNGGRQLAMAAVSGSL